MYVDNLKSDFYDFITGKQICIIAHHDLDSICTCKILQALLNHTETLYTLSPIQSTNELKDVYQEHCEDVKCFVLINCGGTIDIINLLEPEDDITFFVLDSHRPTDLYNLYSDGQIRLLWEPENDTDVPQFTDVFREEDDESEDDESEQDDTEPNPKRRRLAEDEILKRRERRLWESKRSEILFEYSKFSYNSKASALYMFNLAWKLDRDEKDLLWYAIVALSYQLLFGQIDHTQYVLEVGNLQAHAARLQNQSADELTALKIKYEKDVKLVLYRHWTIEASLKYSMYTACRLKLWTIKGDDWLNKLLADMGFPLNQSRCNYLTMDLQLRLEFLDTLEKLSERYQIPDIVYTTFTLSYGYRNKYCAFDYVYGLLSLLEFPQRGAAKPEERFQSALDCLSRSNKLRLNKAIETAKLMTMNLFKTVQNAIDTKKIIVAGPFLYYTVIEGTSDWSMYSHPHMLKLLGQFVLSAYVAVARNRKASNLPLIISAPKNLEDSSCILLGVSPLAETSTKNFFGKAFEQAAEKIGYESSCGYFDASCYEMAIKDRTRFIDALTALLD